MEKSKRKRLYVMIGISGSGKSTYANTIENAVVISRDKIRFDFLQDGEDYFSHEKETFREYIKELRDALKDPSIQNIVADATHMTRSSRNKLFRHLKDLLEEVEVIGIVMNTSLDMCIARNDKRTGRQYVPVSTIVDMFKHFEMPQLNEPFNEIKIIKMR